MHPGVFPHPPDNDDDDAAAPCVIHKWVFEIKQNGVFRARLVACGYSQIPGQDFGDIYSPVVNDVTVCLLIVMPLI